MPEYVTDRLEGAPRWRAAAPSLRHAAVLSTLLSGKKRGQILGVRFLGPKKKGQTGCQPTMAWSSPTAVDWSTERGLTDGHGRPTNGGRWSTDKIWLVTASDRPTRRPPRFGSTKGGGRGPPPYSPQNGCTPLGVTHWLGAAPVPWGWRLQANRRQLLGRPLSFSHQPGGQ